MRKVLILGCLTCFLSLAVILFLAAQGPSELEGEWQGFALEINFEGECDLKHIKKVSKCKNCDLILKGYKCRNCARKKCEECKEQRHLFHKSELNEFKCPCCGSAKLSPADLLIKGKCYRCGEKPEKVKVCVKTVYICPIHREYPSFKIHSPNCKVVYWGDKIRGDAKIYTSVKEYGDRAYKEKLPGTRIKRCSKPLQKFIVDYAEINYVYKCPICHRQYDEPGKCQEHFGKEISLKKKMACSRSGTFPHVNGNDWDKKIKTVLIEIK